MLRMLSKLDRNITHSIENPVVKFILVTLGLIHIFMIKQIPINYLRIYRETSVRIVVALLIAYLACIEPIYAIALTTIFIISIQELQSRFIGRHQDVEIPSIIPQLNQDVEEEDDGIGSNRVSKSNVSKAFLEERIVAKSADPKVRQLRLEDRDSSDNIRETLKDANQEVNPADRTLLENVEHDANYISLKKLRDAQSNLVTGSDPNKPMEIFPNILNAQGMNQVAKLPSGKDPSAYQASLF